MPISYEFVKHTKRKAQLESTSPEVAEEKTAETSIALGPLGSSSLYLSDTSEQPKVKLAKSEFNQITQNLQKILPERLSVPFDPKCIKLTADGKYLVAGGRYGSVGVWNTSTNRLSCKTELEKSDIQTLALYQNGKFLVTGGSGGTIGVYLFETMEKLFQLEGHSGSVYSLLVSPEGKWLYSASYDRTIRAWNLEDTSETSVLCTVRRGVSAMDLSYDGELLALAEKDKINVFHLETGERTAVLKYHPASAELILCIKFSNSKEFLAVGGSKGVTVWHQGTWEEYLEIDNDLCYAECLEFSPENCFLLAGFSEGLVKVWDLQGILHQKEILLGNLGSQVTAVCTTKAENYLVVYALGENSIFSTKLSFQTSSFRFLGNSPVKKLLFSNSNLLFCNNLYGDIAVYDLKRCERSRKLSVERTLRAMSFTETSLVSYVNWTSKIVKWDLETFEKKVLDYNEHRSITAMTASPEFIVTGHSRDNQVTVWNAQDMTTKRIFRSSEGKVKSLAVLKEIVFAGSSDGKIRMYNIFLDSEIKQLEGHQSTVTHLSVSSEVLLSGSQDSSIKAWSIPNKLLLVSLETHIEAITGLVINLSSSHFISSSKDGKVYFWNMLDYSICGELNFSGCSALCLSSDDKLIAVGEESSVIVLENPLNTEKFGAVGPSNDSEAFLAYLRSIISGSIPEHNPEMDKWVIVPYLLSSTHFYAYFNLHKHLELALKNQALYFPSKLGKTPLNYALERELKKCAKIIVSNLKKKAKCNKLALIHLEKSLVTLNKKSIGGLEGLYQCLFKKVKDSNLPKFCKEQLKMPIIIESSSLMLQPENFLTKEDLKAGGQAIDFWQSLVRVSLTPGSKDSLKFLNSLLDCTNQDIFRTRFIQTYLNYKWKKVQWLLRIQALVYLVYLVLLSIDLVEQSSKYLVGIFLINFGMFVYEVFHVLVARSIFFEDMWNFIELFRSVLLSVYCLCVWAEAKELVTLNLLVGVTFLSWVRGVMFFRLFEGTRYIINLLVEVIKDMGSFLFLLIYSTLGFAFIFISIDYNNSKGSFESFVGMSWTLALGEFDTEDFSVLQYVCFFIATIVNPLIMLNLLISIMGDTYDRVQESVVVADKKELVGLILAGETLLYWRRNKCNLEFLQMCEIEETREEGNSWLGKVRELKTRITGTQKALEPKLDLVVRELRGLKACQEDLLERVQKLQPAENN